MADGLAEMWDKAKKTFEQMTGKKKPKESKGIFNAFGSYTGLSGSLAKFDKAETEANKTKESDIKAGNKLVDEMETQLASFHKASSSYQAVLGKAIAGEIDKRTESDIKTTYERALKYLGKELDAIEDTGASRVKASRQRFDEAEQDLSVKQKMLLNWQKNMKAALARAAAAAAKVKASPNVATYNSIFPKAARDVTMQLVFAKELDGFLVDPSTILKTLGPWGQQGGHPPATLPEDATQRDVIQNLAGFVKELKKAQQLTASKDFYR